MDSKIILQRLAERHNITALNDMQLRMQADNSPRAILLAPTGSGKTVGFALRLLRRLSASKGDIQAVVLAPSRELVIQIADVIRPWRPD